MKSRYWLLAMIPGILALACVALFLAFFLIKLLWAWTIPDLFPGAVEQGLVAGSISWFTSLKLAIFVAILAAFAGIGRGEKKGC